MRNKKGQTVSFTPLAGFAITIVLIVVVLFVGSSVIQDIGTSQKVTARMDNDTFEADHDTNVALSTGNIASVTLCWNTTNGTGAPITNYTLDKREGIFSLGSDNHNHTNVSCNYTYLNDTIASNTSNNGLIGLSTFASWLPTIALILAASVVIGIIYMFKVN